MTFTSFEREGELFEAAVAMAQGHNCSACHLVLLRLHASGYQLRLALGAVFGTQSSFLSFLVHIFPKTELLPQFEIRKNTTKKHVTILICISQKLQKLYNVISIFYLV